MNLNVYQNNIKATLTAHGFNDWSEAQKVIYLIKSIKTNIVEHFPSNISGSAVLRDDFVAAAHHVAEFVVIVSSLDHGINHNISGVNTEQGDGSGQGRGEGSGRRG